MEVAREHGLDNLVSAAYLAQGASLESRGQLNEAYQLFDQGVGILHSWNPPIPLAYALLRQSSLLQTMNRQQEAVQALAEASVVIDSCAEPGDALRARLAALEPRRGHGAKLTERECTVLRMLSGTLSEGDIGRELYLSRNTIHSHTKSIFRKLGATSRREAVVRARGQRLI